MKLLVKNFHLVIVFVLDVHSNTKLHDTSNCLNRRVMSPLLFLVAVFLKGLGLVRVRDECSVTLPYQLDVRIAKNSRNVDFG